MNGTRIGGLAGRARRGAAAVSAGLRAGIPAGLRAGILAAILAGLPAVGAAGKAEAQTGGQTGGQVAAGAAPRALSAATVRLDRKRTELRLTLSGPAEWRVFTLDDPPRLAIDFGPVDWSGMGPARIDPEGLVAAARSGLFAPGRSRMVLDLLAPVRVRDAEFAAPPGRDAQLRLLLEETDPADFAARAGWPDGARPAAPVAPPKTGGLPVVVIDPGHGGVDPGAIRGPAQEKDLVLLFSRDLRDALAATGRWRPVMTREGDVFVSLRDRVRFAEHADAAVFLSIHVNALEEGEATGASVHTLSARASSAEAEALAAFENRADLLAGVALEGEGDDVAKALIDLSRRRTDRRSRRLAEALVEGIGLRAAMLKNREHSFAGFRVLKSPAIPSALIELGFMSTEADLERIRDPAWRRDVAAAVVEALDAWAAAE